MGVTILKGTIYGQVHVESNSNKPMFEDSNYSIKAKNNTFIL
jgi:hypothetical protein